jgi:hypothetical protein
LAGRAIAEEQPIVLSDSGRPNGVFHEIVVDSDATLFKKDPKQRSVGEADKQVHLLVQQFDFLPQTRVLFAQLWFFRRSFCAQAFHCKGSLPPISSLRREGSRFGE